MTDRGDAYVPFTRRLEGLGLEEPFDGVPRHLEASLLGWIKGRLYRQGHLQRTTLERLERRIRLTNLRHRFQDFDQWRALSEVLVDSPDRFLDALDFFLRQIPSQDGGMAAAPRALDLMLDEGNSIWTVVAADGYHRLESRLGIAARNAAAVVMAPNDRAAALLRLAWDSTYGLRPDPSAAYNKAIRAVESAAKPVICPNDRICTLGRMIGSLRASPDSWRAVLRPPPDVTNPISAVMGMMELIWKSQLDRHGTDEEDVPLEVTLPEARAALHVAITLVEWFRSGAVGVVDH